MGAIEKFSSTCPVMKIVISLGLFVLFQHAKWGACMNHSLGFPQGKPYNLHGKEDEKWSLSRLTNVADRIALLLREDPPYGIIGDALSKGLGTGGKSPTVSQFVDYEVPFIALASFSLLAALVIPVVGLIFCCCRFVGKCGGHVVDHGEIQRHPTKERIAYSIGIIICIVFLLFAASSILSSSVKMKESISHTRTVWNDAFSDADSYKDNFFQQFDYVLRDEAIPGIFKLLNYLIETVVNIVSPILRESSFYELFEAVLELDRGIQALVQLFKELDSTIETLLVKIDDISTKLHKVKRNLTTAVDECRKNLKGAIAVKCDAIPSGDGLKTEANFRKVPNVTVEQQKIIDVAKINLTEEVIKGNESLHKIVDKVGNLTSNLTTDFQNFSKQIEDMPDSLSKPIDDGIDKVLRESVYPIRDDVANLYLGPDGKLTKYDFYRHVVFVSIASLTLLVALLLLIAVILGVIGSRRQDTPGRRSGLADTSGRLMMGSAGLLFFSAFFVNLLTGILFLVGSNVAVICDDIPDYKILQKTIDDPNIMGGYVLSQLLFKNGTVPLTTSGILRACSKNHAPWEVFKLDNAFNLSELFQYKDKIPSKEEVFETIDEKITNTAFLSDEAKGAVNDSLDAGVHDIEFAKFFEQINKPVVSVNLDEFATNVSGASDSVKQSGGSQKVSDILDAVASGLHLIHSRDVVETKRQMNHLHGVVTQMEYYGKSVLDNGRKAVKIFARALSYLETDALRIAQKGIVTYWDDVFGRVDRFLAYLIRRVRFDLGRCKPLPNIYHGLTNSVCTHYAAGMNAAWVAFGLDAFVLLICIILCVRASKHFRRVSGMQKTDNQESIEDEVELRGVTRYGDTEALFPSL